VLDAAAIESSVSPTFADVACLFCWLAHLVAKIRLFFITWLKACIIMCRTTVQPLRNLESILHVLTRKGESLDAHAVLNIS